MNRFCFICLAFLIMFTLSACSKSPEKKMMLHAENILVLVYNNAGDCEGMAKDITDYLDERGEDIAKQARIIGEKMNSGKGARYFTMKKDEYQLSGDELRETMNALQECENHPAVIKAFEYFEDIKNGRVF